jgi:hypothetical protein
MSDRVFSEGATPTVDHGDSLEGHIRQSPRHVQVRQHAVDVVGFQEDEIAVILGTIVGVFIDDRNDE